MELTLSNRCEQHYMSVKSEVKLSGPSLRVRLIHKMKKYPTTRRTGSNRASRNTSHYKYYIKRG